MEFYIFVVVFLLLSQVRCSIVLDKKATAFKTAIQSRDYDKVFEYLEFHKMDPNLDFDNDCYEFPLAIAARNRDLRIVNLLLGYGASKSKSESSALLCAVESTEYTSFELLEALLPENYNYDSTLGKGQYSFARLAKQNGHEDVFNRIKSKHPYRKRRSTLTF